MNHAQTLLGVAIAVAFATAAIAAEPTAAPGNKADKNQVVPARSGLQPGAAPTVQRMDCSVSMTAMPRRKRLARQSPPRLWPPALTRFVTGPRSTKTRTT